MPVYKAVLTYGFAHYKILPRVCSRKVILIAFTFSTWLGSSCCLRRRHPSLLNFRPHHQLHLSSQPPSFVFPPFPCLRPVFVVRLGFFESPLTPRFFSLAPSIFVFDRFAFISLTMQQRLWLSIREIQVIWTRLQRTHHSSLPSSPPSPSPSLRRPLRLNPSLALYNGN